MSHTHPIPDDDLRQAIVAIAADAGGCWRGSPVAFADRLIHRFDLTHQPVTVADLVTVLVVLRSALALAGGEPFSALGGAATISIETIDVGGPTDVVVVALGGPSGDAEVAP